MICGLRHRNQRRLDPKPSAFDARLGRQLRGSLECLDELRTAIGISRVVERVDADEDVVGAEHFRPCERERQHHGIARRHVGRRNRIRDRPALRHLAIAEQGRSAERREIDRQSRDALSRRALRRPCATPESRGRDAVRISPSARKCRSPASRASAPAV